MAPAPQTGMEKAAMHKLLTEAKAEPVNCVIGSGKDPGLGLLLMHRTKPGRALEKQLIEDIPETKNTRWGTVRIDDDDAKQANFTLNRPISGAARRLVKTLKGTGFSKVKIMLEDGTLVEGAADDEDADAAQAANSAGVAHSEAAPASAAPPPPPPLPPQNAAEPAQDASALARRLAALAPRIPQAAAGDDARKAELLKLATQVNVNIKTGNLTYAATYLEQLATALDVAPPAPPPPPQPAAPAQDVGALAKQLAALIPRVGGVADPARKAELAKLAGQANVNIKTNNLTYAATAIAQLARMLDEGAAAAAKPVHDPAVLTQSGRDWLTARQDVEDEMEKLRASIVAAYDGQPVAAEIDKKFRERTAPVLRTLDASLAVKLSAASKAEAAEQQTLVAEARAIIGTYQAFAADTLLADLDDNPFVPLSIQASLTATLSRVAAALL